MPFDAGDSIIAGKQIIDDDEIRFQKCFQRELLPENKTERFVDLCPCQLASSVIECWILDSVKLKHSQSIHMQPLMDEAMNEFGRTSIGQ